MCSSDIFLGLIALLFPPLPVWVKCGICSGDSLINILLCMLGLLPGLLHSWYIIAKFPEPGRDYEAHDSEDGRVYVFVGDDGRRQPRLQPKPAQPTVSGYGTTSQPGSSSAARPTHAPQEAGVVRTEAPPSYAQVVAGDHKVQTQV